MKNQANQRAFLVSPSPLTIVYHPSVHRAVPYKKSCQLANSTEFAIHVKRNGLPFHEEANMVNYKNFNYVPSSYPAYKNVINNVMGLIPGESLLIPVPEVESEENSE